MHLRTVEALFARYRKRGDAGALAQVFDRTAPELFRLAQHLVRDPLAAEDVLQETFVTAIDAAARWDAERPLVPWLTGILARKASESRRSARREVEPARLHERAADDPAALAEDAEFSRELRAALGSLPELYRQVLERHLIDGLAPAEIARDLARASGTVRMQLHRGLEQLRRVLPAGFAAGAALAALSPRGLGAVREAVLAHALHTAALTTTGAVGAGSLGLGKFALAAAAVLAALFIGPMALLFVRTAPESPVTPVVPSPGAIEIDEVSAALPASATAGERQALDEPFAARVGARLVLRGRVSGPAPSEMPDVALEVRGVARYDWPSGSVARGVPAADGSFEIALDGLLDVARERGALDEFRLIADHPAYLPFRMSLQPVDTRSTASADSAQAELRAAVELRPALLVRGRVEKIHASSSEIHVAALTVEDGVPGKRGLVLETTDSEGRFCLRLAEVGEVEIVACADDAQPDRARLWVGASGATLAQPLRLRAGLGFEGRWLNGPAAAPFERFWLMPDLGPLPGPDLRLGRRQLTWSEEAWRIKRVRVSLDSQGRFAVDGLEPGTYRLQPDLWPILPLPRIEELVELSLPVESREFDLERGLLAIQVHAADGLPQAARVGLGVDEHSVTYTYDGRNDLQVLLPSGSAVRLRPDLKGEWAPERSVPAPGPGERLAVDLSLDAGPANARVRLIVDSEEVFGPDTVFTLTARQRGIDATPLARKVILELQDQSLEIADLPSGKLELELFAGAAHRHYQDFWLPARCEVDAVRGRSVEARFDLVRGGRLRVVAQAMGGTALPATCTIRDLYGLEQDVRFLLRGPEQQGFTDAGQLSARGPVDVYPNLAPGVYEVEIALGDRAPVLRTVRITAGEVSELEVQLP